MPHFLTRLTAEARRVSWTVSILSQIIGLGCEMPFSRQAVSSRALQPATRFPKHAQKFLRPGPLRGACLDSAARLKSTSRAEVQNCQLKRALAFKKSLLS